MQAQYFKDHKPESIDYTPSDLAKLLQKISCPTSDELVFRRRTLFGVNQQISLDTYVINGIRFRYSLFNPTEDRRTTSEKFQNPRIETIQIKNYFGKRDQRGLEIRIKKFRDRTESGEITEKVIVRTNYRSESTSKTFDNNNHRELEAYIHALMKRFY